MLSGCLPFYGATDRDTAKLISAGVFSMPDKTWKHVPNTAKDLVRQLLRFDPNKRPSAKQALKHPWLHQEECPIPLPPSIFTSMREFVAMDRFRQLARSLSWHDLEHVPETEIVRLRDAFKRIDVDNSGTISTKELTNALKLAGEPVREANEWLGNIDADLDGEISYLEFLACT